MGYRIGKSMTFEAAHSLPHLPRAHKCSRPHGHSYTVEVVLHSDLLDDDGFVEDYGTLAAVVRELDHRDLNLRLKELDSEEGIEVAEDTGRYLTTAENLARWLHERIGDRLGHGVSVERVIVKETATTWAEYRREGT